MKVPTLNERQKKAASLGAVVALLAVALLFNAFTPAAPLGTQKAYAQAVGTLTATPGVTATATATNTAVATGFPSFQGNGLIQSLRCGAFQGGATPVPGDCIGIYQGGSMHVYDDNGKLVFSIDGKTGNLTTVGNVIAGASAIKCVRGEQQVLGSATVVAATPSAAGISTPVYVIASLAQDSTGQQANVSTTNSTGVVTLKVWNSALTPVAGTTAVAVDYEECGN